MSTRYNRVRGICFQQPNAKLGNFGKGVPWVSDLSNGCITREHFKKVSAIQAGDVNKYIYIYFILYIMLFYV